MATQEQLTKRARIVRDIAAVRVAAASLSKLLAEDVLVGDAWERAVTVLARCRRAHAARQGAPDDRFSNGVDSISNSIIR
jgi:hypothetical protein